MACAIGSPVARSQTSVVSRWLAMPMAAMLAAATRLSASAWRAQASWLFQMSSGVVLDPAGLREMLGKFLLGAGEDLPLAIEQDGARTGGSLVEGKDVWSMQSPACPACPVRFNSV